VNEKDWISVKAAFTPNFPANTTEEADNAAKLSGVVSRETQLGLLSCIDDVSAEIERIEAEQEELLEKADSYTPPRDKAGSGKSGNGSGVDDPAVGSGADKTGAGSGTEQEG
jgi:hypothetical protein